MQCAKTLTPRTAWYVEGNSKSTHHLTPLPQRKRSAQAGNTATAGGVKDRSRMAVMGAARHGAKPESLTAERRDVIMFLNVSTRLPLHAAQWSCS